MRDSSNLHKVFTSTNMWHFHVVIVKYAWNKQKVYVWSVSRNENNRTLSLGAQLSHTFQRFLIDHNLIIDSSEDYLHNLSHPLERVMVVVWGNRHDVFYSQLLDLSVDLIFFDLLMQGTSVVGQLLFHKRCHLFLDWVIRQKEFCHFITSADLCRTALLWPGQEISTLLLDHSYDDIVITHAWKERLLFQNVVFNPETEVHWVVLPV